MTRMSGSVLAGFAEESVMVEQVDDEALEAAGEAGLSAGEGLEEVEVEVAVEVRVAADEADEVREVGGLSSKVKVELALVGSGLMSTGERALRKST